MNFKRGFRRILFVLSILIALIIIFSYFDEAMNIWENSRIEYKKAKENYDDISRFWLIWNSDEWSGGKKSTVKLILNSRDEYSSVAFDFGDKTVYFDWHDIFPGIDKNMLNMPLDVLDVEAQKSMQQACDNAEKNIKRYETLGTKDATEIIPVSISKALLWGIIGGSCTFVVSWFGGLMIFRFVQWLLAGFRDDNIEKFKVLTGKLLNDTLENIQSEKSDTSMEKYFRTAEYLLLEAKEYVDGAWKMIEDKKYNASIALSRWVLEASINMLWAVADESKTDQRPLELVGEALRNDANLKESMAKLHPDHASYFNREAEKARAMKDQLGINEKLPKVFDQIENTKRFGFPDLYPLYRICCAKSHPGLKTWERFKQVDDAIITQKPIKYEQMAYYMVTASTFYLVSSVYCLTKLEDAKDLRYWWDKEIKPSLENIYSKK